MLFHGAASNTCVELLLSLVWIDYFQGFESILCGLIDRIKQLGIVVLCEHQNCN